MSTLADEDSKSPTGIGIKFLAVVFRLVELFFNSKELLFFISSALDIVAKNNIERITEIKETGKILSG